MIWLPTPPPLGELTRGPSLLEKTVFKRDGCETIIHNQACSQKGAKCGLSFSGFTIGITFDIWENPRAGVGFEPSVHIGPATKGQVPSEPVTHGSQVVPTGSNKVGSTLTVPEPTK